MVSAYNIEKKKEKVMDDLAACIGSVRAKIYAQCVITVFPHNKRYEVCRCDVLWDNKKLYKTHKPVIILILIKAYVIKLMFTAMHDTTHTLSTSCYTPGDWM